MANRTTDSKRGLVVKRPGWKNQVRKELFFNPLTQVDQNGEIKQNSVVVKAIRQTQEIADNYKSDQKELRKDIVRNIRIINYVGGINNYDSDNEENPGIVSKQQKAPETLNLKTNDFAVNLVSFFGKKGHKIKMKVWTDDQYFSRCDTLTKFEKTLSDK